MSQTPYHLRKFVPVNAGKDCDVARAILAFRRERGHKKELLSLYVSGVMAHMFAEHGAPDAHVRRVSHQKLAKMNGVTRPTITKRFGLFAKKTRPMSDEGREKRSRQMREKAKARGKKVHDRPLRALAEPLEIFGVKAGCRRPNLYTNAPSGMAGGQKTRAAEMLAARYGPDVFDPKARVNGFKTIPAWLWHPDLPSVEDCVCAIGQTMMHFQAVCPKCEGKKKVIRGSLADYGRVLATYYLLMGIEDDIPEARDASGELVRRYQPAGVLQQTQQKTADDLGLHVDTVRKYNRILEELLIIKVVPGDVTGRDEQGNITDSDPDKIIWMPDKLLTHELCVQEMDRFMRAMSRLRDQAAASQAQRIHADLLKAWEGHEHSLKAFWNEFLRQCAHAKVPQDVRNALIPLPGG